MGNISPHFSLSEFGLPEGKAAEYGFPPADYPAEWVEPRLRPLCAVLETLREELGGARITIISGYRPPAYDAERIRRGAAGVSSQSQHGQGRAADIQVHGVAPQVVHDTLLRLVGAKRIAIGGLGIYDTFVHVDVRPGGGLSRWDFRTK